MRKLCIMTALFHGLLSAPGQNTQSPILLWPEGAPGALGKADKDIPTLTPYLPEKEKATGAAIVICPGGGYGMLASHEGQDYARFLNELGIAGFVLKYRLGSGGYRHPSMLQDMRRGKKTEIDALNGAVVAMGAEFTIDVPYNWTITQLIKAKEIL